MVTRTGIEPMLKAWEASVLTAWPTGHTSILHRGFRSRLDYFSIGVRLCQQEISNFSKFDKSITKFNKFSPDFLCILAQHKQAVKFCFLAASFIRSVLPILSSRPAFPAMRSLSYIKCRSIHIHGPPSGTRTQDPLIKSQLLYQLS